jgi:hypothetical protein
LATSSKPKNSLGNWCCKTCGTTDEALRYQSGLMPSCYTCQAYLNACTNADQKKKKRAGKGHVVRFTFDEFHAWAKKHPRRCRYCGINDAQYRALGCISANGKPLEALGLDRLVDDDYSLNNIAWCCYICNRTKNSHLTPERMERVGELFREFWIEDLAATTNGTLFTEYGPPKPQRVIRVMPGEVPPSPKSTRKHRPRRSSKTSSLLRRATR